MRPLSWCRARLGSLHALFLLSLALQSHAPCSTQPRGPWQVSGLAPGDSPFSLRVVATEIVNYLENAGSEPLLGGM